MSAKCAKKNVTPTKTNNAIVTRNKSAQNGRQLRAKNKKTVIPVIKKPEKPETKSTNLSTTETCVKDTPLQTKVRNFVQLVEQVDYYPDKLKRDFSEKKTFLKPKPNLKLIASTSRRKLSVPRKGGPKSIPPLREHCGSSIKAPKYIKSSSNGSSSDISMVDMVKLIEDNHSLSDEDFMEILTCPSPVWWEDPPDEGYFEDAICTRVPSPTTHTTKNQDGITRVEEQKDDRASTPENSTPTINIEHEIKGLKTTSTNTKAFTKKKQKLESLLRNIKTDKQNDCKKGNEVNSDKIDGNKENADDIKNKITTVKSETKNMSHTTDEEDLSDLSFNEEEVLNNLENMDIPIEQNVAQNNIDIQVTDIKTEVVQQTQIKKEVVQQKEIKKDVDQQTVIKNEIVVPDVLPPLKRKPDTKVVNKMKSDDSDNLDYNLDIVSHSNFRFISDDDISLVEMNVNTNNAKKMKIVDISSSLTENSSIIDVDNIDIKDYEMKKEQIDGSDKNNEFVPRKIINDLSEYITVYKILSNDSENNEINKEKSTKRASSTNNSKLEKDRGKLNNFFKKCKSNKRLKKTDSSFPAISVRNINDLKIKKNSDAQCNGNEENRLKTCDYCVMETVNGMKKVSCDKCKQATIFACDLCNFLTDTIELYTKHISECNMSNAGRISWKNSFITSQT